MAIDRRDVVVVVVDVDDAVDNCGDFRRKIAVDGVGDNDGSAVVVDFAAGAVVADVGRDVLDQRLCCCGCYCCCYCCKRLENAPKSKAKEDSFGFAVETASWLP